MEVIAGVVVDIDDTLYLERDFVASGFRQVARLVAAASDHDEQRLYDHLWKQFSTGLRGSAFDDLLDHYPVGSLAVGELVAAYRSHQPAIWLDEPARGILQELHEAGLRLGVISDGPPETQANKVLALGLTDLADPIVLTGRWGWEYDKPHPRAFRHLEHRWQLHGSQLIYVADNPHKDFITPRARGWRTVRIRREGQLHNDCEAPDEKFAAEVEAGSMGDLPRLLQLEGPTPSSG